MTTTVLYFAKLREQIGTAEEVLEIPSDIGTVEAFIGWLADRSEGHAAALANPSLIRIALDQDYALMSDALGTPREIAIFPPVTGG